MEFLGNLKQKVGERAGDGQNGPWRINSYLLETVEMYPKRMVVEVRDNIDLWEMLIGKTVVVKFIIDAHEWQGRWFNTLRAYSIAENTAEEQERRTARKMPKPTGEVVGVTPSGEPSGTVTDGGGAAAQPQPTAEGGEGGKNDDDMLF